MNSTKNLGLNLPEEDDFFHWNQLNENMEKVDKLAAPEFDIAKKLEELKSGEGYTTLISKIAKAVKDFITHLNDKLIHTSKEEKEKWNTVTEKVNANLIITKNENITMGGTVWESKPDGTFIVSGECTRVDVIPITSNSDGEEFLQSLAGKKITISGSRPKAKGVYIQLNIVVPSGSGTETKAYPVYEEPVTVEVPNNLLAFFLLGITTPGTYEDVYIAPKVEFGTEATAYTPYTGSNDYVSANAYVMRDNIERLYQSKVDQDNIVNNLITTKEGYALDARQGEALDGKITELKKSVSDGKSAIASAITNAGVSTASDASFATMSSNIANVRTDTTYTDKSHIIYGETAYVMGEKYTGTMPSYKKDIYYYGSYANIIGNENRSAWNQGRFSLWCSLIIHAKQTFTLTGSSGGNTPTTGVYDDGFGAIYFVSNSDGYINCFGSNASTIDLTNYDKILVRIALNSDMYTGTHYLRGWIGLTDAVNGATGNEGNDGMIAGVQYNATSKGEWEHFEHVIDVSNLTGNKFMKVSLVHGGEVHIDSCTFLPKREF